MAIVDGTQWSGNSTAGYMSPFAQVMQPGTGISDWGGDQAASPVTSPVAQPGGGGWSGRGYTDPIAAGSAPTPVKDPYSAIWNIASTSSAASTPVTGQSLYDQAMQKLQGWGNQQLRALGDQFKTMRQSSLQREAQSGLLHTTAAPSMGSGFMRAYANALNQLGPTLAAQQLNTMAQFGGIALQDKRAEQQLAMQKEAQRIAQFNADTARYYRGGGGGGGSGGGSANWTDQISGGHGFGGISGNLSYAQLSGGTGQNIPMFETTVGGGGDSYYGSGYGGYDSGGFDAGGGGGGEDFSSGGGDF